MEKSENNFLPLTSPATRVVKSKERRSFWSENRREIDRIGWAGKYHLSDSEDEEEESEEEYLSDSDEDDEDNSNEEDTSRIDTPINNGEPSSSGLQNNYTGSNGTPCYCHDMLNHRLQDYDSDLKQQVIMEVYNWLNGGYHSCSPGFIDNNTDTDVDGINNHDDDIHGRDGLELTKREREDYHRIVNMDNYWTEVYWAGDRQPPDTDSSNDDDWEEVSDAEWEDVYGARLSVEPNFGERYVAILFLVFGYWVMVFVRSRG